MSRILPLKSFVAEVVATQRFQRLGALDFGMKNIGVAICDEIKISITPYGNLVLRQPYQSLESLSQLKMQLNEISRTQGVRYFVAGFPLTIDRNLSPLCNRIVWILQNLPPNEDNNELTFCLWDESFTTSQARRSIKSTSMKRKVMMKHKDAVAAGHILRSFLTSTDISPSI